LLSCLGGAACSSSFVGDEHAKLELAYPFVLDPMNGKAAIIEAGGGQPVPLRQPVQGGFVLYSGMLLRNLDGRGVTMRAELKDPTTGNVISNLDQRETDLERAPAPHDDWWRPVELDSLSTVPNVPACPDALGRGIAGQPAVLELTATDSGKRTATITADVLPVCPDNELKTACECSCGPNFEPGKCGS
jgi:hypothetical protein